MRKILYGIIIALLFLAPVEGADVAKLLPIEAVAVYVDEGMVVLETDTEDVGRGLTAKEALEDLKKTTSAIVYLDTAKYLLLSGEALREVSELRNWLKPSVKVCVCDAAGKVKASVKYLDVHGNLPKLGDWDEMKYRNVEN